MAFLTRVPVGRRLELDGDDVARAGPAFPLVGASIGAAVGATAAALAGPLPALLAAALALAVGAVLTGALHLDALADTADGLGAHTHERALEIMRDHSIGAYGTVALVLDLLVKAAALAALAQRERVFAFAVVAACLARGAPVLLATALPYARPGGGAGASLTRASPWRAALAGALAFAVAIAVAGRDGAVLAAVAAVVTGAAALGCRRWLSGVTGDTLGATAEVVELAALVAAVALT